MVLPHEIDFGRNLFAAGHTHTIATGETVGTKLIGAFNPEVTDDAGRYGFAGPVKGPWGTGEEAVLVNAIVLWIGRFMPDLASLSFAPGAGTTVGDVAIPTTWWKDAMFVASGSQSFYDAEVLPVWRAQALQPSQVKPIPATIDPLVIAALGQLAEVKQVVPALTQVVSKFGDTIDQRLAKIEAVLADGQARLAAIQAGSAGAPPAPVKKNETLPPKRQKERK